MKDARKKLIIWLISIAIVVGGCAIYVGDYYRADEDTIARFTAYHSVEAEEISKGVLVFEPDDPTAGFIFYPGGKVEYTAYVPLMSALAERGVLCILIKMPCNLAVLDINAASGMREKYPEVDDWYIGGHSLGGTMAGYHLAGNTDGYEGLILLASYTSADISGTDLRVLSIYGSEDGVMQKKKYDKYKSKLPADLVEIVIEGGCHAYFGMYGKQKGDGEPSLSSAEQIHIAVAEIIDYINKE